MMNTNDLQDIDSKNESADSAEKINVRDGSKKNVTAGENESAIHALIIAGQIEGHYAAAADTKSTKYEQLIPTLVAVEESKEIDGLLILLNTIGGDVEAGLAIAELISGMRKPTVSLVLGGSHSIGVPLAVSAKRSFIVPSATMTLHPVRINGLVIGVHQSFVYFEKMQERIIDFIVRNSRANKDELKKLIMKTDEMTTDIGSVLEGNEAVEKGLIDSVGSLGDALFALRSMIGNNS